MLKGVQYEGEETPPPNPLHLTAIKVGNLLANDMGGMDWAGLPYVCEHLGIEDPSALVERLLCIRQHKKPDANNQETD